MSRIVSLVSLGIALLGFSPAANAEAVAGSAAKTCTGLYGGQFYHLYLYQYAYVVDGVIQLENHLAQFSGYFGSETSYTLSQYVSGNHVVYSGRGIRLAFPYRSSSAHVYIDYGDGWVKLCD